MSHIKHMYREQISMWGCKSNTLYQKCTSWINFRKNCTSVCVCVCVYGLGKGRKRKKWMHLLCCIVIFQEISSDFWKSPKYAGNTKRKRKIKLMCLQGWSASVYNYTRKKEYQNNKLPVWSKHSYRDTASILLQVWSIHFYLSCHWVQWQCEPNIIHKNWGERYTVMLHTGFVLLFPLPCTFHKSDPSHCCLASDSGDSTKYLDILLISKYFKISETVEYMSDHSHVISLILF